MSYRGTLNGVEAEKFVKAFEARGWKCEITEEKIIMRKDDFTTQQSFYKDRGINLKDKIIMMECYPRINPPPAGNKYLAEIYQICEELGLIEFECFTVRFGGRKYGGPIC